MMEQRHPLTDNLFEDDYRQEILDCVRDESLFFDINCVGCNRPITVAIGQEKIVCSHCKATYVRK